MRICVLKFAYFVISVARSVNSTVRSTTRKYYHFVSDFQFNSRIFVENCVVGICNNGMFLEFHEFETKYLAGVYKRHWTTMYVEYMLNYIVRAGHCRMISWLQFV